MELMCRRTEMDGEYDIKGDLLGYPFNGEGQVHVVASKLHVLKILMMLKIIYIKETNHKFKKFKMHVVFA